MSKLHGLVLTGLILALGGCKIDIKVPTHQGALIESVSGSYTCTADSSECVIDVVDLFFDETFVATPNFGYKFKGWKRRKDGLCGGRSGDCRLFTSIFEGYEALIAIIESDQKFYLEAKFKPIQNNQGKMNTVGLWSSALTNGECSLDRTLEIWIVPGEGLYTQFQAPSMIFVDLETCETAPVSQTRALGPLIYFQNALVTAEELQAGWATADTRYTTTLINADSWALERSDGIKQVFTRLE